MAGRFYVCVIENKVELPTYYGPFASASIMRKAMDQYMQEAFDWMEEDGLEPKEIELYGDVGGMVVRSEDESLVVKVVPVLRHPLLPPGSFHW